MGKILLGTSAIAPSTVLLYEMYKMPAYIPVKLGYELDENNKLVEGDVEINYNCAPATDLADNVLTNAYSLGIVNVTDYETYEKGNPYVKSADFSTLTQITGSNALYHTFYACDNLDSVDFSNLVTINANSAMGYTFCGRPQQSYEDGYTGEQIIVPAEVNKLEEVSFPKLKTIQGNYAMSSCFHTCPNLEVVNFPELETISGNGAVSGIFSNSSNVVIPSLAKLKTISGERIFGYGYTADYVNSGSLFDAYCKTGTTFTLPALETINGNYCLQYGFTQYYPNLSNLTTIDLPHLQTISGDYAMAYCFYKNGSSLTTINWPLLSIIRGNYALQYAFGKCTSLTSLSFPSLTDVSGSTNQFNNMLNGVTGCTVHFPTAMQSTLSSWSDVKKGFGGTNTTVLFDL